MPADTTKNILELEQRTVQMRALQIVDYTSKFLDLIPQPQIEGGKAYYIANIANEPAEEDKRGILPSEIEPSKAVQQIVELNKVKVFRDVINEEIMSLSLDRVKEFTEGITEGMFTKFAGLIDKEIVAELTEESNYQKTKDIRRNKEVKYWKSEEVTGKPHLIDDILDDVDFLLNPSNENNKAEVVANSKNEGSVIWLVKTSVFNAIRRKHLTVMNQPKYGDFTANLRGVIRWNDLPNDVGYVLFDYRKVAAPYNIKDYTEWYYGLDKCTYLRLKVGYGLETLDAIPAIMAKTVETTI